MYIAAYLISSLAVASALKAPGAGPFRRDGDNQPSNALQFAPDRNRQVASGQRLVLSNQPSPQPRRRLASNFQVRNPQIQQATRSRGNPTRLARLGFANASGRKGAPIKADAPAGNEVVVPQVQAQDPVQGQDEVPAPPAVVEDGGNQNVPATPVRQNPRQPTGEQPAFGFRYSRRPVEKGGIIQSARPARSESSSGKTRKNSHKRQAGPILDRQQGNARSASPAPANQRAPKLPARSQGPIPQPPSTAAGANRLAGQVNNQAISKLPQVNPASKPIGNNPGNQSRRGNQQTQQSDKKPIANNAALRGDNQQRQIAGKPQGASVGLRAGNQPAQAAGKPQGNILASQSAKPQRQQIGRKAQGNPAAPQIGNQQPQSNDKPKRDPFRINRASQQPQTNAAAQANNEQQRKRNPLSGLPGRQAREPMPGAKAKAVSLYLRSKDPQQNNRKAQVTLRKGRGSANIKPHGVLINPQGGGVPRGTGIGRRQTQAQQTIATKPGLRDRIRNIIEAAGPGNQAIGLREPANQVAVTGVVGQSVRPNRTFRPRPVGFSPVHGATSTTGAATTPVPTVA